MTAIFSLDNALHQKPKQSCTFSSASMTPRVLEAPSRLGLKWLKRADQNPLPQVELAAAKEEQRLLDVPAHGVCIHRAARHLPQAAKGTFAQLDSSCSYSGGAARAVCSDLSINQLGLQMLLPPATESQDVVLARRHTTPLPFELVPGLTTWV